MTKKDNINEEQEHERLDTITLSNLQESLETCAWHVVQTAKRCVRGGENFDWEDLINDIEDLQALHYVIWTFAGGDKTSPRLLANLLLKTAKGLKRKSKKKAKTK